MTDFLSSFRENLKGAISPIFIILILFSIFVVVSRDRLIEPNWGINNAHYMPSSLFYVWIILTLVFALLLVFSPRQHILAKATGRYLWGDRKPWGRLAIMAIFLVLFVVFRFEAHLYDNSYIKVGNFFQRAAPIMGWYEFGNTLIPYTLYALLGFLSLGESATGILSYQIVSFASGILYLFVTFRLAAMLSDEHEERLAFWLLVNLTGLTLFFFGLVGNGPPLVALGAVMIYLFFKLSRTDRNRYLSYAWIAAAVGLFFNVIMVVFIPPLFYLTARQVTRRKRPGDFIGILGAAVMILVAVIVVYLVTFDDMYLSKFFLFWNGKLPTIDYGIFGRAHLADILNLFYLYSPIFLIYLLAVIYLLWKYGAEYIVKTLLILTVAQLCALFMLDPRNGMARDFSVYGALFTGFIFMGSYALLAVKKHGGLSRGNLIGLAPVLLFLIFPIFYVHLSPSSTLAYLDDYLEKNETRYESALLAYRDYFITVGDFETATENEQLISSKAPGALESNIINDLYKRGRAEEALQYAFELVERFPYKALYRIQKGNLLKHYRRYTEAEKELRLAVELEPYRTEGYHFLSELYRETGRERACLQAIEAGLAVDPQDITMLIDQAGYYYRARRFRNVDSLAAVIIGLRPDEPYGYMYRGLAAESRRRYGQALKDYRKFIELNETLPEVPLIHKRINRIEIELEGGPKED